MRVFHDQRSEDRTRWVTCPDKTILNATSEPPLPDRTPQLLAAADGYDPAAAETQAAALCAKADHEVIAPLKRLLGAYRRAAALTLLPVGAATAACGFLLRGGGDLGPELALASLMAPMIAYLFVRLNFLAIHEADYERELLFDLDLGAERRRAAAEFMTLDRELCRRGLQDFAGRTRALISLTRTLDKSAALLAKDVRYLYRAVASVIGLCAVAGLSACVWAALRRTPLLAIGEALGALVVTVALSSLILWSARRHIEELLSLLAPPSENADAFVTICARILGLLGEVVSQNEFLRRG